MDSKDNPSAPGLAHQAQAEAVEIVRTVHGGTLAMRRAGERFLPRFPREAPDGYAARLGSAVLFNALKRTVEGLAGMVFRKDPKLGDDVPEAIRGTDDQGTGGHWENIDLAGRHGAVFAKDVFHAALLDGHTLIFVDYPALNGDEVRTRSDERRIAPRPYWTHYLKQDLRSFRVAKVGGRIILSQIALTETVTEGDGDFGEREVEKVRVYRLPRNEDGSFTGGEVVFQVWRKAQSVGEDADVWEMEGAPGTIALDFIPLVSVYAGRTGFLTSDPPLLDLALENIAHYQIQSDRRNHLHIGGTPIPVFIGVDEETELVVGSDMAIRLPVGADAKYLEITGASLGESRTELQDILLNMAALGLAMLQRDTRAAETAEAKRIDKSETDSRLSSAARALLDAIEEALGIHARWMGLDDGGSCEVNRDFETQEMDPQTIKVLSDMVAQGQLSLDALWDKLKAGGVLPDTFDGEVEAAKLAGSEMRTPVREAA